MPKKPKQEEGNLVNWGADDLTEGGFFDDEDVRFDNCRFERTDYDGELDDEITVFAADITVLEDGEDGEEFNENWSCGNDKLRPSEDEETESDSGPFLINIKGNKGVNSKSKFGRFVASLGMQGFPADKFTGRADILDGLVAHVVREEIEYKGIKNKASGKKETVTAAVTIVTDIHKMPWEKGDKKSSAGKSKSKSSAKDKSKSTTTKSSGGDDLTDKAHEFVRDAIADAGGTIKKSKLSGVAFKELKGDPDRASITKLIGDADFLESGPWDWDADAKTLSIEE